MPNLISLLDVYGATTYQWADRVEDGAFPGYEHMLTGPFAMTQRLPGSTARAIVQQSVEAALNNVPAAVAFGGALYGVAPDGTDSGYGDHPYGGGGPQTLSEIARTEDLLGTRARARLYDLDASSVVWTIEGQVTGISRSLSEATLTIQTVDLEAAQNPVPAKTVASVFASADLSGTDATSAPVIVVFGVMRKVRLVLCQSVADTSYDYGPFRKPATGSLVVNNVYRNGRLVAGAEYSLVESPTGYHLIRFAVAQTDANGSPMTIQADVTATEFVNPALAIKFLLSDANYGLGKSVNAASFTAAASAYTSASLAIVGGLGAQRPCLDVLDDLLLHGASLNKNHAGEFLLTVDQASIHTAASVSVGCGDGEWENLDADSISDNTPQTSEVIQTFILRGLLDPGFSGHGGSQYLISSTRTDATQAGRTETRDNPFLGTAAVVEREGHYRWHRMIRERTMVEAEATLDLSVVTLGELVTIHIPALYYTGQVREARQIGWQSSQRDTTITGHYTVQLVDYDAEIFTFAAGVATTTTHAGATALTDYYFTPPGVASSFTVTSSGSLGGAGGDGSAASIVLCQATAPAVNVSHLLFRAHRASQAAYVAEIQVPVAASATVTAEFELTPGVSYDLRVYAQNIANDPGAQLATAVAVTGHTAAGDVTAPDNIANVAATPGTGKAVGVSWDRLDDLTLAEYIIYRDTSADPTDEHARSRTNSYTDTEVAYGNTYHYRVKAIDHSGNPSDDFSNNDSASVVQVGNADSAITASALTAGTLTVNTSGVKISATGDSALSFTFGAFAKIKWWATPFDAGTNSEKAHIGAGSAGGFSGLQIVTPSSTSDNIRLGTSGNSFTNLGLWMTGNIRSSTSIFDGVGDNPPGESSPNRRIKIETDADPPVLVGYIWASDT